MRWQDKTKRVVRDTTLHIVTLNLMFGIFLYWCLPSDIEWKELAETFKGDGGLAKLATMYCTMWALGALFDGAASWHHLTLEEQQDQREQEARREARAIGRLDLNNMWLNYKISCLINRGI